MIAGRPAAATALPIRPFQGTLPWPADGVLSVGGATSHIGPEVRLTATGIQAGETSGTLIVQVAARCGGVDLQAATASISVTP